jgi:hypothetical protein
MFEGHAELMESSNKTNQLRRNRCWNLRGTEQVPGRFRDRFRSNVLKNKCASIGSADHITGNRMPPGAVPAGRLPSASQRTSENSNDWRFERARE